MCKRDIIVSDMNKRRRVFTQFRTCDLKDNDLPIIAQVKRIAVNLDKLYRLLGR